MRYYAKGVKNVAVFDIEYRLTPEDKFPLGLNDCWQGYSWVINNAKEIFGIDYKKVVVHGDSAGGNLAVAITAMAIERKFRVPDMLMPVYPCVLNSFQQFVPAHLTSLSHAILGTGFMCAMYRELVGDDNTDLCDSNRFISCST